MSRNFFAFIFCFKQLGYVENSSNLFYEIFYILFQGKEMPAKKKLGQTKLRAVLANFGFPPIFQKINMFLIDINFFFFIVCILREYLRENDFLRETI